MFTVGIDLGTTSSVISFVENGQPRAIEIDGRVTVPSVVNYATPKPIVGLEAIYKADCKNTVFSVKRSMGSGKSFFGRSATEVSADILSYIKLSAELKIGRKIDAAVITVPAHFSDAQRTATKQAASIAGIKVLRLINEPTAAAIAFGLGATENTEENYSGNESLSRNGIFGVYDFGGGTFDFSVLRLSDGVFQVLATGGDNYLGGDDIDNAILEYNLDRNHLVDVTDNEKFLGKLVAKSLKEDLQYSEFSERSCLINHKSYQFSLSKENLKMFMNRILERTFEISSQVLEDSSVSIEKLDGIVLVGGMTKLDLVKQFTAAYFRTRIFDNISPEKAVSFGAAIQADSIISKNMLLIDVVPLTLGIETFGGGVDKIIHRNTPIPISETREYTTYQDNQEGIKFKILQGERPLASECRPLADFELKGIPPMPAGMARVIVEFSVDVNGLLSVKAYEKTTKVSQQVVVESSAGLSDKEMMDIIAKAFKEKEADELKANHIAIRVETERSIKFWKTIIDELPQEFQEVAAKKINLLEELLRAENFSEVMEIKNELESIFGRFADEIINAHLSGRRLSELIKTEGK